MRKLITPMLLCISVIATAQTNPAITRFLQNTSVTARHYLSGNSTPINDASLVNVQSVKYSANYVYATTTGLPSYVTGPYLDGNTNLAGNQNSIFKFPLNPTQNTGTGTATTGGNIGVFINGVALFDYRDGVSWKSSTNALAGGPTGGTGDGVWNRDAVVGEKGGFDCSKGHPAGTNYHHHQNPSAFNLDLSVISTVCNLYNADGLYAIDNTQHSPLLGFAYDGFPIYGAYGYKNADGTGGIVRIKSSYALRNITVRNTYYTGQSVTSGPNVSTTYPLGYFKEDYAYTTTSAATPDYLDDHNGRFCVTPEYPNGIYCYFSTVDANWNSSYPYVVGPTFYGNKTAAKVTSITESTTTYPVSTVPSIYIAAYTKTICSGTSVAFTAAIYNGGLSPTYQWKKNGVNVGTNTKTYSNAALANGDVITCVLTTASSATTTSNSISMSVTALTTTGSVTQSQCGGTYTWPANGVTYSTSGIRTVVAGCNTATLNLTINTNFTNYYADTDGDGYGSGTATSACSPPANTSTNNTDCAPTDSLKWRTATLYIDTDGDGWNAGTSFVCYGSTAPSGYSLTSSGLDCNDNAFSINNTCPSIVNLKLFVQGYYAGAGTMVSVKKNQDGVSPLDEVEDITVELHKSSDMSLVATTIAKLKTNGTAVCTFASAPIGLFYIAIKGSSLVQTWSAAPQAVGSTPLAFYFSTSDTQAYTDGSRASVTEIETGVWAVYSGDNNHDDSVDLSDVNDVATDSDASNFGVLATDLNGDGAIDLSDVTISVGNSGSSIYAQHP